jgi:hypothetical protein
MKPYVNIINQNGSRNKPRPTDIQQINIKYSFVACYTHNINEWSNLFTLLYVTMRIWIEKKRQLIIIIDDWHKEGYCMNLERNSNTTKQYYIDYYCTNRIK